MDTTSSAACTPTHIRSHRKPHRSLHVPGSVELNRIGVHRPGRALPCSPLLSGQCAAHAHQEEAHDARAVMSEL
eukprot:1941635-Alexandrium_andersonii.AAC.1